jgi:hypothetical protein
LPIYWLTPIVESEPLRLGSGRIACQPMQELEALRSELNRIHPRLLPMFKASLLLSDDEESCGSDAEVHWLSGEDLVFDGKPLMLSHCAEAFMDHVLSSKEALGLLEKAIGSMPFACSLSQEHWVETCKDWLSQKWQVILFREDAV